MHLGDLGELGDLGALGDFEAKRWRKRETTTPRGSAADEIGYWAWDTVRWVDPPALVVPEGAVGLPHPEEEDDA